MMFKATYLGLIMLALVLFGGAAAGHEAEKCAYYQNCNLDNDPYGEAWALFTQTEGGTVSITRGLTEHVGKPSALDGETIEIDEVYFRLWGIRAPVMDQTCWGNTMPFDCGVWAKKELEKLIRDSVVRCKSFGSTSALAWHVTGRCWLLEGGAAAQKVLTVPLPNIPVIPSLGLELHESESPVDGWDGTSSPERFVVFESSQGLDIAEWMVREGWAFDYRPESQGEYAEAMSEAWANRNGLWDFRFVFPWSWAAGRRGPWATVE